MISKENQLSTLKKITKDPLFSGSAIYKDLLKYLVDCSLNNRVPHEKDIAINVLGKNDSFDPYEDTLVRVHIYKLRKKLEAYYNTTGKKDKILLTVPKGHYHVSFTIATQEDISQSTTKLPLMLIVSTAIVLIVIFIYQTLEIHRLKGLIPIDQNIYQKSFVWSALVKNESPTILALGELFAFSEHQPGWGSYRLVRDERIHSMDELQTFIDLNGLNPDDYRLPVWEIIPKSGLINILALQPIFKRNFQKTEFRTTGEIQWDDLNQYNIIYIGHYHNLNILADIYQSHNFKHQTTPVDVHYVRQIKMQNQEIDTVYTFIEPTQESKQYVKDYVTLTRIPGPMGNELLFVISFHHIGRTEVIKNLINGDEMQEAVKIRTGTIPNYFEILFEVEGFRDTALKTNILHVYELADDFRIQHDLPPS